MYHKDRLISRNKIYYLLYVLLPRRSIPPVTQLHEHCRTVGQGDTIAICHGSSIQAGEAMNERQRASPSLQYLGEALAISKLSRNLEGNAGTAMWGGGG